MEYEQLHKILRKPNTNEERILLMRCFKEGKKNGWASGRYDRADGNFLSDNDCLNGESISFIDSLNGLIAFFRQGNWCLGTGIIYKNLFFLEQVNGGSEWAIYDIKKDEINNFESYSIKMVLDRKGGRKEFMEDLNKMLNGSYWDE